MAKGALFEGWLRESSLALELIVKGVLAERAVQTGGEAVVPNVHDVPKLWRMAQLPRLSRDDEYRLLVAYQVLQWAGRYAAPRKGRPDLFAEMRKMRTYATDGRTQRVEPLNYDWDSFDALFQQAQREYFAIRSSLAD